MMEKEEKAIHIAKQRLQGVSKSLLSSSGLALVLLVLTGGAWGNAWIASILIVLKVIDTEHPAYIFKLNSHLFRLI